MAAARVASDGQSRVTGVASSPPTSALGSSRTTPVTHKTFRLPYTDSLQKCALTAADCCGSSKRLVWSDRLTASRKRDDATGSPWMISEAA